MPDNGSQEPTDFTASARNLRRRTQELVERLSAVGQSGQTAFTSIADPLRSFLEAGAVASAAPANQVRVVAEAVRQHRAQIETLRQQLDLFDDQLQVLEHALAPLVAWSEQWSKSQESVLGLLRPPSDPKMQP